ncbi:hypothetical protein BDR03DRAFT_457113 [Suillus americanus]|nr:hypothetical protein BDR03DRAFT_457113 [Suillus americanus]
MNRLPSTHLPNSSLVVCFSRTRFVSSTIMLFASHSLIALLAVNSLVLHRLILESWSLFAILLINLGICVIYRKGRANCVIRVLLGGGRQGQTLLCRGCTSLRGGWRLHNGGL